MMDIIRAMEDPELFGKPFKPRLLRGDTWASWKSFLRGLFALPMSEPDLAVFREHTGRVDAPTQPFNEAYIIAGRRSGKTRTASLIGTFLAAFRDYSDILAPGEFGTLPLIACDRKQASVLLS